jgi:hypothetical protein
MQEIEGGVMNKQNKQAMDPARVALLIGITLGLGIVVHEGFFLVAGAIAVGSLAVATAHTLHEHTEASRLTHHRR